MRIRICRLCYGAGMVELDVPRIPHLRETAIILECPECQGSGGIASKQPVLV